MRPNNYLLGIHVFLLNILLLIPFLACAEVVIELHDNVNLNTTKIFIAKDMVKIESNRKVSLIRLDKSTLATLNPSNMTYNSKSFNEISVLEGIRKRYNRDYYLLNKENRQLPKLSLEFSKKMQLKNKNFPAYIVKYKTQTMKKPITVLAAQSLSAKIYLQTLLKNSVVKQVLKDYFSPPEMSLLEKGYLPFRSTKLYTLNEVKDVKLAKSFFDVPVSYKKRVGGDFYKDMAVDLMKKAN